MRPDPRTVLAARIVWAPVSVLAAGCLAWCAVTLLPGDAATNILGPHATAGRLAELRAAMGLDRPALEQMRHWLRGLLSGDLGTSILTGQPVVDLIAPRLGASAVLAGAASALALGVGIPLGTMIGLRPRGRGIAGAVLLGIGAVPDFVVGSVAVGLLAVSWRLLPSLSRLQTGQWPWQRPEAMVIPVLAMALPVIVWVARYTAAVVERQERTAHVRAARLMGVSERRVLLHHLLPGALAPLFQLFGWMASGLVGSTVVVEQLVEFPGIGSLLGRAVSQRDTPVAVGIVTVLAAVIAVSVLVCDLAARRLDPRLASR